MFLNSKRNLSPELAKPAGGEGEGEDETFPLAVSLIPIMSRMPRGWKHGQACAGSGSCCPGSSLLTVGGEFGAGSCFALAQGCSTDPSLNSLPCWAEVTLAVVLPGVSCPPGPALRFPLWCLRLIPICYFTPLINLPKKFLV